MATIFETTPVNAEYHSPVPNQITLLAGAPNEGSSLVDDALCKELKECGFNALSATLGVSYIKQSLLNCSNNNLKLFIDNAGIRQCSTTASFINSYKNDSGLGGWMLKNVLKDSEILDPDNPSQIAGDGEYCPYYKTYQTIEDLDPNHPIFVGINADWTRDVDYNKKSESLPSLIKKFQDQYHPSFWPWVYFPDLTGGEVSTEERWAIFYKNLQYFAYISRYTATPFWTFCLCQGFNNYYGYNAPTSSLGVLRQMVFSALAYGAQGIYYSKYRESISSTTGGTTYHSAPIDRSGNKTEVWDYVQTVNKLVKTFNGTFYGCEMIDCRHITTNKYMENLKKMTHPIGPLLSVSGGTPDLLISHIHNNGLDYLMILNTSLLNDKFQPLLTLHFSEYWNIFQINSDIIPVKPTFLTNYDVTIKLNRGEFVIYAWY